MEIPELQCISLLEMGQSAEIPHESNCLAPNLQGRGKMSYLKIDLLRQNRHFHHWGLTLKSK